MQPICYTTGTMEYPNTAYEVEMPLTAMYQTSTGAAAGAEPPADPKKKGNQWVKPVLGILFVLILIVAIGFGVYFGLKRTSIGVCSTNPCQNGGTCKNLISDYSCSCTANFYGKGCQWGVRFANLVATADTSFEGRVEVYDPIYKEWEVICDTTSKWDIFEAHVVCRMMGLSGGTPSSTSAFGQSTIGYRSVDYECLGMEDSLQMCPRTVTATAAAASCTGNEVGVKCNTS